MTQDTDLLPPIWIVLPDQSFIIRCWFTHSRSAMNFRVWGACFSTLPDGAETWELIDCGDVWSIDEWEEARWDLDGALKWDGCINWQTNPQIMMHGCGPNHVDQLNAIFSTIYHVGKRHMSLLDDEAPALPENALEL